VIETDRFPKLEVRSADALRSWLENHHAESDGVWLVTYRAHVRASYVSREAVLDELLCFGWVDGIRRKLDDDRTMQLITPRRTHEWTASYRQRVARLEAEGRLAEPGREAIAVAKASGGWVALPDVDALLIPEDLAAALVDTTGAHAWFDNSAPSYRRNVLRWIAKAQRPETRATRIATVAATAGRGEKIRNM
jgi:uncharacterized protein YdeI (YjbR/CyaY-like superfamily)